MQKNEGNWSYKHTRRTQYVIITCNNKYNTYLNASVQHVFKMCTLTAHRLLQGHKKWLSSPIIRKYFQVGHLIGKRILSACPICRHLEPWDPGSVKGTGIMFHWKLSDHQSVVVDRQVTPPPCWAVAPSCCVHCHRTGRFLAWQKLFKSRINGAIIISL